MLRRFEHGRPAHRRLQCSDGGLNDSRPQRVVLRLGKAGIATHVLNSYPPHDTTRPHRKRDSRTRAHHRDWNTDPLDLFGYRCTAAIAAASGGDQQDGVYSGLFQFTGDSPAHVLG
jgi:hypothetical protein